MIVGVPREIKQAERRVGLTPDSAAELAAHGHEVVVETGAGAGIGAGDDLYRVAGARIVATAPEVWSEAELVVKVKEPQAAERTLLGRGQTLFTYLHLAPDPDQTRDLLAGGSTCIAYETVVDDEGGTPLLAPMSQVAGRMAVQAGAHCLEAPAGGSGVLLGGVPGVAAGRVVVLGGGMVGEHAIEMAIGLGAHVTVLDRNVAVLDRLDRRFGPALQTVYSTRLAIEKAAVEADLFVGAVLVRGARTPRLLSADMVARMPMGSVIVDVAVDQGGCCETTRPTTHEDPTYVVDGVVHYCVANMPGAVPRTSTYALNNVTLPYVLALADHGPVAALLADPHLLAGLNVHEGQLTEPGVAEAQGLPVVTPTAALGAEPPARGRERKP